MNISAGKVPGRKRPDAQLSRLQAALEQATSFAGAYPNNAKLWSKVRLALEQLLIGEWRAGRLLGMRADEAFFIRCDASTMTQNDILNARLVAVVGVALRKPAEFEQLTIVHATAG